MAPKGMKCRNPAGNEGLLIEIGMSSTAFKSTSVFSCAGLHSGRTHWLWPGCGAGRPAGPRRRSQSIYGVHVLPLIEEAVGHRTHPRLPISLSLNGPVIFSTAATAVAERPDSPHALGPRTIRHPAVMDDLTVAVLGTSGGCKSPSPCTNWHQGVFHRAGFPGATSRPIQFSSSRFQSSSRPKICIQVSSDICDMRCQN